MAHYQRFDIAGVNAILSRSSHSGTWQLIATPNSQGTGVRITIATAHRDSPIYVSKMDSGVVQAMIVRDYYKLILDNISH